MSTMPGNLEKYLSYWKFALADSQLGKGTFSAGHMRALEGRTIDLEHLKRQSLVSDESWLTGENSKNALTLDEVRKWLKDDQSGSQWLRMVVYPFVYLLQATHQHGQKRNFFVPEVIAPVSFTVLINESGEIRTHGRPGIARELLEPAKGARSILIGAVDKLDGFFDGNPFPDYYDNPDEERVPVAEVLDYCNRLLNEVCEVEMSTPAGTEEVRYTLTHGAMAHKARQMEASNRPLLEVYDAVLRHKPESVLLSNMLLDTRADVELPPKQQETISLRAGSMLRGASLGQDQRLAVGAALLTEAGDALAVNGPPGTGKTTMIQAVVAGVVVSAAKQRQEPPIIVVASTNNQAVTNVLGSLKWASDDNELFSRWVDGWSSFGLYLPSFTKREISEEKGLPTKESYDLFEARVSIENVELVFVERASRVLGIKLDSLWSASSAVHERLLKEARILDVAERFQAGFESVKRIEHLKLLHQELVDFKKECAGIVPAAELAGVVGQLSSMLQEMAGLFRQLQSTRDGIRAQNARYAEALNSVNPVLRRFKHLPVMSTLYKKQCGSAFKRSGLPTNHGQAELRRERGNWQAEFGRAIKGVASGEHWIEILQQLDSLLDRYVRPRLFAWAAHWYESEWIREVAQTVKAGDTDNKTKVKVERMLRRRSMLAPCMVATFHTLPKHLKYWEPRLQREVPLFEAVDWLINDEAGQCAPEVAGASLLLAKRLVAVGDCWQIEPIWNIEPHVDMGNLVSAGIVAADELDHQLDALKFTGRLASSGSTMKMAQSATWTGVSGQGQPGLSLTSHRRCLPEIIQYCNELCYEGALNPLRISDPSRRVPPLGWIHAPGKVERVRGSRLNRIEAAVIAQWLTENAEALVAEYGGLDLADIVAVVTPFKEQARTIRELLVTGLGQRAAKLTVGTIHALQGAERPIVMFSPTYSMHDPGTLFFDGSPMMLNVAVSRAKDSFIVIGDLDVLRQGQRPSRLLYEHLIHKGSVIDWSWNSNLCSESARLTWGEDIAKSLSGYEEHLAALNEAVALNDVRTLTVISQEVTMDGLRRFAEPLMNAARAGIHVQLVVGEGMAGDSNQSGKFSKACELLEQQGIAVHFARNITCTALFGGNKVFVFGQGSWLGENGDREVPLKSWFVQSDAAQAELIRCLSGGGVAIE